jgi:hypothetical protein
MLFWTEPFLENASPVLKNYFWVELREKVSSLASSNSSASSFRDMGTIDLFE